MRSQRERSEWVTGQWRQYKSKRNPWPFRLVCISSCIYLFLTPALLTLWSNLLSLEHLQKRRPELGKHTHKVYAQTHSQCLCLTSLCGDLATTAFHCCVSPELLSWLMTSGTSFSLFKPCKTCNKLHVIMLGILGRALLCGVLGGTSALAWSAGHPAFTLCEPPMPPSAHFAYSVTRKHSLSPLLHPKGACYWLSRTRCGEYREKDFSLCFSDLVHIYVFMFLFLSVKITNELTILFQN